MLVPVKLFPVILFLASLCACLSEPKPQARQPDPAPTPTPVASNAQQSPKEDTRKVLVVFGDSIAAGFGLEPGLSFPDEMQKKIDAAKLPWRVVNLGISGDTTEEGVARMDSATSLKPAIVIVELGGNDGLRGLPLTSTRKNLDTMIRTFQGVGARVVLAGMTLPPNYGHDFIQDFQKMYKDLAAQYHLTLIPFLLADIVTPDMHYFQRDGIHPTADGAAIVAETAMRSVKPLLANSPSR